MTEVEDFDWIGDSFALQAIMGFVATGAFMVALHFSSGLSVVSLLETLAYPGLQSILSQEAIYILVVTVIAPPIEEPLFRGALPYAIASLGMPLIFADIISSAAFSTFHWFVYGGAAATGALLGAFLFGMFMVAVRSFSGLAACIGGHSAANLFLTQAERFSVVI